MLVNGWHTKYHLKVSSDDFWNFAISSFICFWSNPGFCPIWGKKHGIKWKIQLFKLLITSDSNNRETLLHCLQMLLRVNMTIPLSPLIISFFLPESSTNGPTSHTSSQTALNRGTPQGVNPVNLFCSLQPWRTSIQLGVALFSFYQVYRGQRLVTVSSELSDVGQPLHGTSAQPRTTQRKSHAGGMRVIMAA